jgi:NAD(P)-dependent dehydrogenase (short-subunit alcohol dehydrogenase family)
MKINKAAIALIAAVGALTGCIKNQDIDFPDYNYKTVYFGLQYVPRTVELGEDEFVDNSLDNQHKVLIQATMGGVRENKEDVTVGVAVDNSLCNRLYFPNNGPKITPLPSTYYKLASNQITIPSGSILGGVEVELTDAFFADPQSINNTYAIPLVLSNVKGADSILRGKATVANADRTNDAQWAIKPRDWVLYGLKYINQWHGTYLRRGRDVITGAVNKDTIRHKQYVEQDELNKLTTTAYRTVDFPVIYKAANGSNINCTLQLTFDAAGTNCTVTAITPGFTATGSGKFVKKGEIKSWGNKDRDALYLDYTVNMASPSMSVVTKDTLVMRDRSISFEVITPVYK